MASVDVPVALLGYGTVGAAVNRLLNGRLQGARLALLGAAFKPDSDDIRDSAALDVAATLHAMGADVVVTDPAALDNARRVLPRLDYADTAADAARDADAVLLLTEWDDFRNLDPKALGSVVRQRVIVDARNVLDRDEWAAAGWTVRALGRGAAPVGTAAVDLAPVEAERRVA